MVVPVGSPQGPAGAWRRPPTPDVAIVHDYLTQRGGAERVVAAMAHAYPGAPVHTSIFDPGGTFPGFAATDVRVSPLDRIGPLRRRHRLALPALAPTFSAMHIDAEVTLCSSSGWSHGARCTGRKIVYCHTPARWLYQSGPYLAGLPGAAGVAVQLLGPTLRRWDRRAAATADRYLVNSEVVRRRVRDLYHLDAEVLPPPVAFDPSGPVDPEPGSDTGFFLCVARLLAYKNVGAVLEAFAELPDQRLLVVGTGPLAAELARAAPSNVRLLGEVEDDRLRWLYRSCVATVAASYEDFGLTPIEAATYGKPSAVLRWGGFLDTVVEGETGVFFDRPTSSDIVRAVRELVAHRWSVAALERQARRFSLERFTARLRDVVDDELG